MLKTKDTTLRKGFIQYKVFAPEVYGGSLPSRRLSRSQGVHRGAFRSPPCSGCACATPFGDIPTLTTKTKTTRTKTAPFGDMPGGLLSRVVSHYPHATGRGAFRSPPCSGCAYATPFGFTPTRLVEDEDEDSPNGHTSAPADTTTIHYSFFTIHYSLSAARQRRAQRFPSPVIFYKLAAPRL